MHFDPAWLVCEQIVLGEANPKQTVLWVWLYAHIIVFHHVWGHPSPDLRMCLHELLEGQQVPLYHQEGGVVMANIRNQLCWLWFPARYTMVSQTGTTGRTMGHSQEPEWPFQAWSEREGPMQKHGWEESVEEVLSSLNLAGRRFCWSNQTLRAKLRPGGRSCFPTHLTFSLPRWRNKRFSYISRRVTLAST